MDCLRAPLYNTCRICFDSGTEQYEAFNDNSSLKPIPTNTYRGGIVLYVDTDLNDLFTVKSLLKYIFTHLCFIFIQKPASNKPDLINVNRGHLSCQNILLCFVF